jgi:hypothetical protein
MSRRHANPGYEERVTLGPFDHAQVTATTTVKLWKCPTGRDFIVDRVIYMNVTGLAEHADNWFTGKVQNAATVVATLFDTDSDGAGTNTLAADTFVEGTMAAAVADRVVNEGEELSLVLTEGGTATLPAGFVQIEGRYVS